VRRSWRFPGTSRHPSSSRSRPRRGPRTTALLSLPEGPTLSQATKRTLQRRRRLRRPLTQRATARSTGRLSRSPPGHPRATRGDRFVTLLHNAHISKAPPQRQNSGVSQLDGHNARYKSLQVRAAVGRTHADVGARSDRKGHHTMRILVLGGEATSAGRLRCTLARGHDVRVVDNFARVATPRDGVDSLVPDHPPPAARETLGRCLGLRVGAFTIAILCDAHSSTGLVAE